MSDYRYCDLKIQINDTILDSLKPSGRSQQLASWLLRKEFDRNTGRCIATDAHLADRLGCSTDTIARAVKQLRSSGLFKINRGRRGRATEYALSPVVWEAAMEMKNTAKLRGSNISEPGRTAGLNPAKLPSPTQQNCRPSLREDKNKEARGAPGQGDCQALGGLGYNIRDSHRSEEFSRTLVQLGYGIKIEDLPSQNTSQGPQYLMPKCSLPKQGSRMRDAYETELLQFLKLNGLLASSSTSTFGTKATVRS